MAENPEEPTAAELNEVTKEIAGKCTSWEILFSLLDIPSYVEQDILKSNTDMRTKIFRMLRAWKTLHHAKGTATRANLASILRTDPYLQNAAEDLENLQTPSILHVHVV